MELKTYQGRSMSDALGKVKAALGSQAVILHTRTIRRGGVLGIGARNLIEITATADPRINIARKLAAEEQSAARNPQSTLDPSLSHEVKQIRTMVEDLLRRKDSAPAEAAMPAELVDHYTRLITQQVSKELASQLLDRVSSRLKEAGAAHWNAQGRHVSGRAVGPGELHDELLRSLTEMIPAESSLQIPKRDNPSVIALVGPTGVGKTTTIAKLAANFKLREGLRVGLITIDTYRIAAVEQLRTYAQILKVPVTPVITPREMREAIGKMNDCDVILIDTAGRSQRDEPRLAELSEFLDAAEPDQIHLVLSSTHGESTIRETITGFAPLGVKHVIFTKLDEAVGLGVMLSALQDVDLRLSYLTNGQSVPDDIEPADATRVARMILGESPHSVSARPKVALEAVS